MFVALSRFTIRNDIAGEVRLAFSAGPHLVDKERGFIGMQVMSPLDNPAEIWLVPRWTDKPVLATRDVPADHLRLSLDYLGAYFGAHMDGSSRSRTRICGEGVAWPTC